VNCYFLELEFIKDARKSLLKGYRLEAPCMSAGRLFQIIIIRTGYFHGETTSVCVSKVYSVIIRCSGEMRKIW